MKREIKFRAWDKKEKFMIDFSFGDWIDFEGKAFTIASKTYDTPNIEIEKTNDYELMQFTGKKDKNGAEVYEGDFDSDGNVVVWCENCNGWEFGALDIPTNEICIPCHRCDGNFFFEDQISDFEVIGNICQNAVTINEAT